MENQLREYQEALPITLNSICDGIIATDARCLITGMNPVAARLTGWTAGEAAGRPFSDIFKVVKNNTRATVQNPLEMVLATGESQNLPDNTVLISKDGKEYQITSSAIPIRQRNGRIRGVVLNFRDVTTEYRQRQVLHRTQFAVENASDEIYFFDRDGRLVYANHVARDNLGISEDDLFEKTVFDFDPDRSPDEWNFFWDMMVEKGAWQAESVHRRMDGTTYPVEINSHHINIDGVDYRCSFARDISERKKTEEALANHARQEEILGEIAMTFVSLADFDTKMEKVLGLIGSHTNVSRVYVFEDDEGGETTSNVYEWCNKGITPQLEQLQSIPYQAIPSWKKIFFENGLICSENVSDLPDDLRAVLEPQEIFSIVSFPIYVSGKFFGFVGFDECTCYRPWSESELNLLKAACAIISNAYERVLMDRSLRDSIEAAQAANRTKSAFLANMSHEIRTPMNAILGYAQLMSRDKKLSSEQKNYLERINNSGEHLLELINDILEMSKIEAGASDLAPKVCDFHSLLRDVEAMFKVRTDAKGLEFEVNRGDNVPRYLFVDEGKIRQVLINLLSNAIKFTETGKISITIKSFLPDGAKRDNEKDPQNILLIEVADSGEGIKPEDIELIFEPFRQGDGQNGLNSGTGLGLPISREYARMMSGDLTATSEVGKGSLFRFKFIVEKAQEYQLGKPELQRRVLRVDSNDKLPRILVVDDREMNRDVLVRMLSAVGFVIHEAVDGQGAIDALINWQPDLIFMDMMMPVMDGREATRRIKALPEGKDTPIIMVSASAMEEDRVAGLASGADGFIRKPYREQEILQEIGQHLPVKYIYEDETDGPEPPALVHKTVDKDAVKRLPSKLKAELFDSVCTGDFDRLEGLLGQVAIQEKSLAGDLQRLADAYEYTELYNLLEDRELCNAAE
jgi:two-component system sensor histidine kinase/response regulator